MKVAIISVVINIVLSLILIGPLKHGGLALALSVSATVNFLVLFIMLRSKLGNIDGRNIARSFVKISFASLVMGLIGRLLLRGDIWMESGRFLQKSGKLAVVIGLCIVIYFLMMRLMKSEELKYLLNIRKKTG